jgi:hypothetical protein
MGCQVLRYYGHFQEAVLLSAIETYRIRHITFHFFLSDDTLEIVEPKEENSGIMQACLAKQVLPRPLVLLLHVYPQSLSSCQRTLT